MKKRSLVWSGAGLAAYLLLMWALTEVEAPYAQASIRSFPDALWYSLVTLTTVGYGDLYPVSPGGRVIGGLLALMSLGLLAAVIGVLVSMFKGNLLPWFIRRVYRRRPWYLFSEYNEASHALAKDILQHFPGSLCVFGKADKFQWQQAGQLFLPYPVTHVLKKPGGKQALFLISPEPLVNTGEASALQGAGVNVYCLGGENEQLEKVHFFDPFVCCARRFWLDHPLAMKEERVLIAGSGAYAQAILENAILSQSRQPVAPCEYHLFGDWTRWRSLHPAIDQVLAVDESKAGMDGLYFHLQDWFHDQALLAQADRIILCHDDEKANVQDALAFSRLIGGKQALYVRTSQAAVPGLCFGQASSLYTAEMVMAQQLDAQAQRMHGLYRSQYPEMMPWEELSPFLKASNRAAADHQPVKRMILNGEKFDALSPERREQMRRVEHHRWMRFYSLYNWRWGEKKDPLLRRHPCLLPYEQLSAADRAKDDYAWQMLEE